MRSRLTVRRAGLLLAAALLGVVGLAALSGCGVVRTLPPKAIQGSPAASGPHTQPYVASEQWGMRQVPIAGRVEPPLAGAFLGVYVPPAPFDLRALERFNRLVGRTSSIVMWYQPWSPNNRLAFDSGACLAVMRRGAVPMITWEPWDPGPDANQLKDPANQPQYRLSEINAGYFDGYLREWARDIKRLGGPIMLRPMHEMNGQWYPWAGTANGNTPEEYVKAWRRMHDIFEQEGATNVTWVWSVNGESVPDTRENVYSAYYPGDSYVDWTSISSFNWGDTDPTNGGWRTWSELYRAPLAYLTTLPKPICISEVGSVEQGGDKAAWIADAYARIQEHPQIGAVIYFNSLEKRLDSTQDWRITTSTGSLAAYRAVARDPYLVTTPPRALVTWAAELKLADWTYLGSLKPRY